MEEQLSTFAREVIETKRQVLSERDSKKLESTTQKLKEMKIVNPDVIQKLMEDGRAKIRAAVANGKNEAIILTFDDRDVVRPPDQVSWCPPRPDWIRANYLWVFRAFERERSFKPRIEDWINQETMAQGYAIWVSIP